MNDIRIFALFILSLVTASRGDDEKEMFSKMAKLWCDGQPDVEKYFKDFHGCDAKSEGGIGKEMTDTCFKNITGLKMADSYEESKKQYCSMANLPELMGQLRNCSNQLVKAKGLNQTKLDDKSNQCVYGDLAPVGEIKLFAMIACLKMQPAMEAMFDDLLKCNYQSIGPQLEDRKKCFKEVFGKDFPGSWQGVKSQACSALDDFLKYHMCFLKTWLATGKSGN
ncbi:hypothetical protein HDE_11870 [Halotydeus destructor]|nr:hypothetical protein HDE_11870 [Halotydeus destructor]